MGPLVLDKRVKFHDPGLNHSREMPPKAARGSVFDCFPLYFRPEVDNDIISGMAVDNVGRDVPIKCGNSSSNGFRYIRAVFVSNEGEASRFA